MFDSKINEEKKVLMTFCNPLLDITARVTPSFLAKYSLLPNDSILSGPSHVTLTEDLFKNYGNDIHYSAGGAGQNATRAAQWLLQPGSTIYCGCIGNDDFGNKLREQATNDGLQVEYMITDEAETGTCLCLLTDNNRSLVASLNAASHFNHSHLLTDRIQSIMHSCTIFYITGFFVTVSMDSIRHIIEFAKKENKLIAFNLSAPFLCEYYREQVNEIIANVDFLFGNDSEAIAYHKNIVTSTNDSTNVETAAKMLAKYAKHVIITQGSLDTIHCTESIITTHPVDPVSPDEIVDTNGAGDAFVGGFLASYLQDHSIDECIDCGHRMASMIIKTPGISFDQSKKPNNIHDFTNRNEAI